MKYTSYKQHLLSSLFLLIGLISLNGQNAAPDLAAANVLCDKETSITIDQFAGAGTDADEATDGCLDALTETNTTWFVWEAADFGNFTFNIDPTNGGDRFAFSLFRLPNGLLDGTDKATLRCAAACRTGALGLRTGDADTDGGDCSDTDGFLRPLSMEPGFFYALMIENTTSDNGFTISFGGDGPIVSPMGNILPSATETCFGQSLDFGQDITFANGNITNYAWTVVSDMGQSEDSQIGATATSFTFDDAQVAGTKDILLTVTTSINGTTQTCTADFETSITINSCCDSDNRVEIVDTLINQIACPSDANGAIDLVLNQANPNFPHIYIWSNGVTTEDLTRLTPDTYSVTVSNDAGCKDSLTYTFSNPDALTVRDTILQVPSCRGGMDGVIEIVTSGGRAPYMYDFNDGNGFVAENTITGLGIGDYKVVIMDASGCSDTTDTDLDEKELEVTLESQTNPTCADLNNGVVEISSNNFVGTLQFDFNNGQGPVGQDALSMLDAGSYTVDVIDSEGCMGGPVDFILEKPDPLVAIIESRNGISCNGANDGTAIVTPDGGTPDYTFLWSNGETTRSVSDLSPGTYTVTVTDQNGCTLSQSTPNIVDPPVLTATVASNRDVSCSNENDGQIVLDVDGGIFPYFYTTDGLTIERDTILSNLSIGDYDITVTDNNDCEVIIPTTSINSPALVSFSPMTGTGSSVCYGQAIQFTNLSTFTTGNIAAVSWDFGNNITSTENNPAVSFTTIGKPTVSLTVTSDLGCSETLTQEIDIPVEPCCDTENGIILLPDLVEPLCSGGNSGEIFLNPSSFAAPITSIEWTTGEMEESISELTAGSYGVTVTNDATCEESTFFTLSEPIPITATLDISQPTCDAAANGTIVVSAQGGTINAGSDYNFNFNNNGYSANNTAEDLMIGAQSIMIRDDNNCEVPFDTLLAAPEDTNPISANLAINSPSCETATNGAIQVNPTGNGPFLFNFDGTEFTTNNAVDSLMIGNYRVVIQDADNCELAVDTMLSVSPNAMPITAEITQVNLPSCGGGTDGSFTILPDGELGTDLANYTFDFGTGNLNNNVIDNIAAGDFVLGVVTNANNCSVTIDTILNELVLEPATPLVEQPSCFGDMDGAIRIQVPDPQGVEGPFMFAINGGAFQDETALENLSQGDYDIVVQDANNCLSESILVTVPEPEEIDLEVAVQEISCFAANDGQITVTAMGGNGNFTYDWNDGQATSSISNLAPDDYLVTVTDFRGCRDSLESAINLTEPDELLANLASVSPVLCFGESNGTITVTAMGGSGPYEYSLDGVLFQPSASLGNLAAGDYNVVIRDSRGCEIPVEDITVDEPGEFTVTANVDDEVTKLGFPVNLSATVNTTAIGAINYLWTSEDSIICNNCERFEIVPAGSSTFTVTAVNSDNCQATDAISVLVSLDRPVYIPNIFSPNGDGINDEFYIPFSPSMSRIESLQIYDRSGSLVFEVNDVESGEELTKAWDGEFNGSEIRQGVFVVIAQINFVDGQTLPYQSDLTLITSEQ